MAVKPSGKLPGPPPDLARRELPLQRVDGSVFRIHRTTFNCLYFGKKQSERFDDPLGQYGVLYAALQPEAAFAEVFLRHLSLMLIPESSIHERSISELHVVGIRCVDLSGAGLRRVSCDNRIATEKPYPTVWQWSRALFTHPQEPDGLIYRSRHNPQFKCLALFDRCETRVTLKGSEPLMSGSRRAWTVKQIARYDMSLEPIP
jgi:hypothetical protein